MKSNNRYIFFKYHVYYYIWFSDIFTERWQHIGCRSYIICYAKYLDNILKFQNDKMSIFILMKLLYILTWELLTLLLLYFQVIVLNNHILQKTSHTQQNILLWQSFVQNSLYWVILQVLTCLKHTREEESVRIAKLKVCL